MSYNDSHSIFKKIIITIKMDVFLNLLKRDQQVQIQKIDILDKSIKTIQISIKKGL